MSAKQIYARIVFATDCSMEKEKDESWKLGSTLTVGLYTHTDRFFFQPALLQKPTDDVRI